MGLREQAREETQDREQRDREDRRRGRAEARRSGISAATGLRARLTYWNALARTKASTTIGVRKRTPPRIVVPTKCDRVFKRASCARYVSNGSSRQATGRPET
jgi:hypothetical protein